MNQCTEEGCTPECEDERRRTEIVQWFECPACSGHGCKVKTIEGKRAAVLCSACDGLGERGATEEQLENMDPGSNNPFCRHTWNQSAGEADEAFLSGEGDQRITCVYCGADGDA